MVALGALPAAAPAALTLAKEAPPRVLLGSESTVTLRATNDASGPYGYNLSFRDVLPPGVSYVPDSARFGASPVEVRVIADAPAAGQTTLIFENVSDISVNSAQRVTYRVRHATSGPGALSIGDTFVNQAAAYANEQPRIVPAFDAGGEPIPSPSGMASSTAQAATQVSAIKVEKSEPSPEGELLRGLHDHQTVYTVRVTNNGIHPTTGITVDDYLPAGLEFLGCGAVDNTTSAGTNLGSTEEYPGSGAINAVGNAPAGLDPTACRTPALVETIRTDADAPQPAQLDPGAVYTHVRWTGIGNLEPGETVELQYVAAVPLRENTLDWSTATSTTGGSVPAGTRAQTANLDNNSGPETRDEQALRNHVIAAGVYRGDDPDSSVHLDVEDRTAMTRTAEDLAVIKSVEPGEIRQNGISEWRLRFRTSEYRRVTDAVATDVLPNGLCPLGSRNYEDPTSTGSECDPVGGEAPSLDYQSVDEQADGSWTISWALPALAPSTSYELTFPTRTRRYYQRNYVDDTANPVRAGDGWTNTIDVTGDDHRICADDDVDCSGPSATPIDGDGPDSRPVDDESSASQTSGGISIDKTVLDPTASGVPTPIDCAAAQAANPNAYVDASTVPTYGPGDRICWRLRVDFSSTVDTGSPEIRDFIPAGLTYDAGSAAPTGRNTIPGLSVDDSAAASSRVLSWQLDDVDTANEVFEWTFSTTVTDGVIPPAEQQTVTGNLMKLAYRNTGGETFSLRDRVEAEIVKPVVGLVKDVTSSTSGTVSGGNASGVVVGAWIGYRVRLSNDGGEDAQRTVVFDELPAGITCNDIVVGSISDGGSCATLPLLGTARITWDAADGITVPAGGTKDLAYMVLVPNGFAPASTLLNRAGVVEYQRDRNGGGGETFVPASNIDPTRTETNAPRADDPASVTLRDVAVAKSVVTTSVDEVGNNAVGQATIGETITYRVQFTVPAGTTLFGTPTLTDAVNARMELLSTPTPSVTQSGGTPVSLPTPTVDDNQLTLAFPGAYANTAVTDAVFTVVFQARVRDVTTPANANRRGETLPNSARLRWLPEAGAATPAEKTATAPNVTIVEPDARTYKTAALLTNQSAAANRVSAGDGILYTIAAWNESGSNVSPLHETTLVDVVPAGITPRQYSDDPDTPGEPVSATGQQVGTNSGQLGVWDQDARTITWSSSTIGRLNPGGQLAGVIIRYVADVDSPAPAGAVYTNSITATGTSLAGSDPNERTSDSAFNTGYASTSTKALTVEGGELTKTAASPRATVGDLIDYTVEYTLPANVAFYDLTFIDTLPDGVAYVPGSGEVECLTNCSPGLSSAPAFLVEARNPATGTERLAVSLDDVPPSSDPRTVRVTYQGRIMPAFSAAVNGTLDAGDALTNSVSVYFNAEDKAAPPDEIPDVDQFDQTTGPETTTTIVQEPRITLDKAVNGIDPGDDSDRRDVLPGDELTYTVTVTNTGTSPAYDVDVTDTPGDKLVNVVATASGVSPSGTATVVDGDGDDGTLAWRIPGPLAPGATVTLTYEAEIAPSSELSANETVVNTATVPSYWNASETERDDDPDDGFRSYTTDPPTDDVTLDVRLPNLQVQKTTGVLDEGSFLEAADAEIGESFPWRIVITNPEPSTVAVDAEVTDVLPPGWTLDADSVAFSPSRADVEPTVTSADTGDTLHWDVGDVLPGEQIVITFTATPDLASKPSPNPQQNAVTVTARDTTGATASADGPYEDADTADANLQLPTLTVAKTPDGADATAGTTASYSVVVRNTSSTAPARDVEVTDVLGAYQTYAAGSATASPSTGFSEVAPVVDDGDPEERGDETTTIGWRIASIPAGGAVTITVPVAIDDDLAAGTTLENGVSVVSREITDPATDDGSLTTTVSSDVGVEKTITAPTGDLVPGETVTYAIEATNHGPSVATGVEVADVLPAQLAIDAPPAGCSVNRQRIECSAGTLAVGASKTFTVTATVDPAATGTLANTATVTSATPDDNPDNDSSTVTGTLTPEADLVVTKAVSDATLHQGDAFTYTVEVRNAGPSDAVGVTLTDALPAGVELGATAPTTDAGTCTPTAATNTVNCALGTIAAGDTVTVTIPAVAVDVGTHTNTASATTTTAESSTTNNADDVDVTVDPVAEVAIEKTAPATVAANDTLTYALQVTNAGPSPATEVVVTDELPDGVEFVSASPGCTHDDGTVRCTLASLPVTAEGASFSITVHVPWTSADTTLSNTATVTAEELDRDPDDNASTATTEVGPAANLRTTKTAPTLPVPQTVPYEYEVTVQNAGPSTAEDVRLSDPMPAGVTALDATSSAGSCTTTATRVDCQLGDLAVGASATVTITARGDLPGTPTNTATASSDTPEVDPADDADDAEVTILAASDVGVVKHAPRQIDADELLTYRLEISNHGPSDATGVTVTDALPAGVELRSASPDCAATGRTVVCTVGELAAGATVEREIVVHVPHALGGQKLTNVASVVVDQVDLNPDNDSSQVETTVGDVADLAITKTAGAAVAGGKATWVLTVTNAGPTAAEAVVVRDDLPVGTAFALAQSSVGACHGSGRQVLCELGTLAAGASAQITVVADVADNAGDQTLRNVATVASPTADPEPGNDVATADVVVSPAPPTSPDLRVTKAASTDRPVLGRALTYRIQVTNVGGVTADDVRLTDTMNRSVRINGITAQQGRCTVDGGSASCELGAIAPGQTVTVDVRVTPETPGELENTVSVQAAGQAETQLRDNSAVAGVRVQLRRAAATIRKTASKREIRGGQRVSYAITVKMGKQAGSNLKVCDRLPRGLTFVRATGARFSKGQACWTVRYLGAGASKTFRIVARAERSDETQTIRNRAVLTGRNVSRRTASATVDVTPALAARAGGVTG